jgi:hypothetical protein
MILEGQHQLLVEENNTHEVAQKEDDYGGIATIPDLR